MDVVDDADGSLDPRIQIELENLNNATDDINKLETELDEAHTAFRQLLSESTKRLKEILDKIGSACIERARCYYEALEVARQAQVRCQQQAQLFQRASEIHAAAKETVALAEARFMSHQHEWDFDQAWQDMLNHATIKVMDAENQKAECGREHHRRAMLFHDAEKRLLQLEEKHRRSIIKARPYFEVKAQCDHMLSTQKERVECLQRAIKDAKKNYASSLRTLEEISNHIHQQRRDYDLVVNGPREPGVGAELVSPEDNVKYESEYSRSAANRINAINQAKNENKASDNVKSAEDEECLDKRSVDGSEATAPQWELELQVSLENLNNLSLENAVYDSSHGIRTSDSYLYEDKPINSNCTEVNDLREANSNFRPGRFPVHTLNHLQKLSKSFQLLKKPLTGTSLMSHFQRSESVTSDITCESAGSIRMKNQMSKSLNSSPININIANLDGSKLIERLHENLGKYVPNNITKFGLNNQKSRSNNDVNLSWNLNVDAIEKYGKSESDNLSNDILDHKTDKQIANAHNIEEEECTAENISDSDDLNARTDVGSTEAVANNNLPLETQNQKTVMKRPKINVSQVVSRSASSTPIKVKTSFILPAQNPLDNNIPDLGKYAVLKTLSSKTASIKELPLLSLFEKSGSLANSKGKSFSMVNLDDKKSLTVLLDNSGIDNIQAVSAKRLANARDNLLQKVPR